MGLLEPVIRLEYQQVAGDQFGVVSQRTETTGDNITTLLGIMGTKIDGILLERSTGTIIREPKARYQDFGLAQTTRTGTGALWKDVLDVSSNKRITTQYSGAEDVSWSLTSNFNAIDVDNGGFAVDLYFGAPPKATTTRDATGIYRRITWASNSASGENRYRVTIGYEEMPYIEKSKDAGATWKKLDVIPCPMDPQQLKSAKNVRLTLSVLVIDGQMAVWLGQDLGLPTFVDAEDAGYKAGPIKIDGAGGYTSVGFAPIRHKAHGEFTSYRQIGQLDMVNPVPQVHCTGTPKADLDAAGQTTVGEVVTIYPDTIQFDYKVTLTGTELDTDPGYTATSQFVRWVNVVWPILYTPHVDAGWTDIQPFSYWEKSSFDPGYRVLRRMAQITSRIYAGEFHPLHGVESVRIHMAYQHVLDNGGEMSLRGYFVGNTEVKMRSVGRDSFAVFDCHDKIWFLEPQSLRRKVFPGKWCIYSLVRMLLETGGIVPDYYQRLPRKDQQWIGTVLTPTVSALLDEDDLTAGFCDFGPDPEGCNHPKFGTHPGWMEETPVLAALDEIKDVVFYWYGEDITGQFRFEPFDPASYTVISKAFTEGGTGDGSNYDEIGGPEGVIERIRSVSGVKNYITFIGIDQKTGELIPLNYTDQDSIHTRSAPNYTGGVRPWIHASSVFVDKAFTQQALDAAVKMARLPYEGLYASVNGQPEIYALELITAKENRTFGAYPVAFLLTDHEMSFLPPGRLTSVLQGVWNGLGSPPGVAPARPPKAQVVLGDVGSIPPDARRRRGTVQTGTAA